MIKAIREGICRDGSVIGPPMPFEVYQQLSDDYFAAIVRTYGQCRRSKANQVSRPEPGHELCVHVLYRSGEKAPIVASGAELRVNDWPTRGEHFASSAWRPARPWMSCQLQIGPALHKHNALIPIGRPVVDAPDVLRS